ncbi:hypothetical protein BGX26_003293, partial [Mortierella sp. AD094]
SINGTIHRLSSNESSFPVWSGSIPGVNSSDLEYSYVKLSSDGSTTIKTENFTRRFSDNFAPQNNNSNTAFPTLLPPPQPSSSSVSVSPSASVSVSPSASESVSASSSPSTSPSPSPSPSTNSTVANSAGATDTTLNEFFERQITVWELLRFPYTYTNPVTPKKSRTFKENQIATIHITSSNTSAIAEMNANPYNEMKYTVDFKFINSDIIHSVPGVALNIAGKSSKEYKKQTFRIKFDGSRNQTFFNRPDIKLRSMVMDPTYLREKVYMDILNSAGLPSQEGAYVRLFINNEPYGLYFMMNAVEESFIRQTLYGGDNSTSSSSNSSSSTLPLGSLVKMDAYMGDEATLEYQGANSSDYNQDVCYEAKINTVESSAQDPLKELIDFMKVLSDYNNASLPAVEGSVVPYWNDTRLGLDGFLKNMAIEYLTGAFDNYWHSASNYFMYRNPTLGTDSTNSSSSSNSTFGKRQWIAYDYDGVLGNGSPSATPTSYKTCLISVSPSPPSASVSASPSPSSVSASASVSVSVSPSAPASPSTSPASHIHAFYLSLSDEGNSTEGTNSTNSTNSSGDKLRDRPFVRKLILETPEINALFEDILKTLVSTIFKPQALTPRVEQINKMLTDDVQWDLSIPRENNPGKDNGFIFADFNDNLYNATESMSTGVVAWIQNMAIRVSKDLDFVVPPGTDDRVPPPPTQDDDGSESERGLGLSLVEDRQQHNAGMKATSSVPKGFMVLVALVSIILAV